MILRDTIGLYIGTINNSPLLSIKIYEIEYQDRYKVILAANHIAISMFAQVNDKGNMHILFNYIIDSCTYGVTHEVSCIKTKSSGRKRYQTTKGWEILIQYNGGSFVWEIMTDVRQCYPVQLEEFTVEARLI